MKIGIIGCGYVGQSLATFWRGKNHHISATTRSTSKVATLQSLVDDVCSLENNTLASFINQQEVLVICVAPDANSDYNSTYLETAKQIKESVPHTPRLRQIIYTSSTSVYGEHGGEWVDETTVPRPSFMELSERAQILSDTEQILMNCSSSALKVCVFRLGEIIGPGRRIEDRLRRMAGQPFPGTGSSYTNLIHVDDIVNAIDFALKKDLEGFFNLCNDFHVTRKEFYDILCQKELLPPIQWDPSCVPQHKGNKRVSNQKLKNEGFCFTHP